MKFVCLIAADKALEQMTPEEAARVMGEFERYNASLRERGQSFHCNRLLPPETATTVRLREGRVLATDGPFAETKEQIGGFYVIDAADRDEAIALAAGIPAARFGSIEVRPIDEHGALPASASDSDGPLPRIVDAPTWLAERKALLAMEKALTRQRDAVNEARRRLPRVRIDKPYRFQGPAGPATLTDLFDGRPQLLVYHFMFDPAWHEGCPSCSLIMDNLGHLAHLHARRTSFAAVSRAPLAKLQAYAKRMGWTFPWYSSHGSDFNHDFQVSHDEAVAPVRYNFMDRDELVARGEPWFTSGESHGASVFVRDGDDVYHTYSTYARGVDELIGTYNWLDLTPFGRQEDWEKPAGRSDGPFMHWVRRHDQYEAEEDGRRRA